MRRPLDVIHEVLLQPVPCEKCEKVSCRCLFAKAGRLKNQSQMILAALTSEGLLHVEQAEPTAEDFEVLARWLADQSQHPRYVMIEDGWSKLLESEHDVTVAYAAALKTIGTPSVEQNNQLGRARDTLVAEIRRRRAADTQGV
jgi:hypothetical protein